MSPNMTTYYWAEQSNRQRLSARAERGWLSEEAAASRRCASQAAKLRWAMGALLVRVGIHLQDLAPMPPLTGPSETRFLS